MASKYFMNQFRKAQLICFIMISNEWVRFLNQNCHNDSFMIMYTMLSFYSCFNNQPYRAAIYISLSISLNAVALFYIPVFIGCIQNKYGLLKLIPVIAIALAIQVVVALPFVWDPAAYALGFKVGAQTTILEYLDCSKLAEYLITLRNVASLH